MLGLLGRRGLLRARPYHALWDLPLSTTETSFATFARSRGAAAVAGPRPLGPRAGRRYRLVRVVCKLVSSLLKTPTGFFDVF